MQQPQAVGKLRLLADWAERMGDRVRVHPPDGGVTAFVEFPDAST